MGQDLGYLNRFLSSNAACLDQPRHHFITKISITFDERDVSSCRKPLDGELIKVSTSRARLLERLEHLFLLKHGASIHIYVTVPFKFSRHANLDRYPGFERKVLREVVSVMSDTLSRLRAAGYNLATGLTVSSRRPENDSLYDLLSGNAPIDGHSHFVNEDDSGSIWRYVLDLARGYRHLTDQD
jgi:hypothetical protein